MWLLLLCSAHIIVAQESPIKFGKIDIADLQLKTYDKDTTAEALVLCDFATSFYTYRGTAGGLKIVFERHRRIKIFKKTGYEWASLTIGLASLLNAREYLLNLKGATYNLVDGKMVTDKLEKESIFEEKKAEGLIHKKITLPNVKEGSIIEYSYRIESDFSSEIRAWEFQKGIPTLWSEYRVHIPSFYQFQVITQGYEPFFISEITSKDTDLGASAEATSGTEYRFVLKDVPALKAEPFMTTIDDYRSKVEFEISAYIPRNELAKHFSITWDDFSKSLNSYPSFGHQLNRNGFLKDVATTIKTTAKDSLAKIQAAYQYITQNITWNQQYGWRTSNTLKKAFESKTGNVADINLMLVVLLRELDIPANPIMLSTRDNGRILDSYVLERKFNYVIAGIPIQGQWLLLDATEPSLPLGVLPIRCLNGQGRLIKEDTGEWVSLASTKKHGEMMFFNMEITPEAQVKGRLAISYTEYAAYQNHAAIKRETTDKYIATIRKTHPLWEISNPVIEVENIEKPVVVNIDLTINEAVNSVAERIYINPMLGEGQTKNPFTHSERKYPIDFGTISEETIIAVFKIPKGYVVEEAPKSVRINLPNEGGRFGFTVASDAEKISVTSKVQLKKTMYYADDYEVLKLFYNQIVQKHAEQIVLKKAQ